MELLGCFRALFLYFSMFWTLPSNLSEQISSKNLSGKVFASVEIIRLRDQILGFWVKSEIVEVFVLCLAKVPVRLSPSICANVLKKAKVKQVCITNRQNTHPCAHTDTRKHMHEEAKPMGEQSYICIEENLKTSPSRKHISFKTYRQIYKQTLQH